MVDASRRRLSDHGRLLINSSSIDVEVNIKILLNPFQSGCTSTTDCFDTIQAACDSAVTNGKLSYFLDTYSDAYAGDLNSTQVTVGTPRYSTFVLSFAHSPRPSSQPTSMPTCGAGSFGVANNCGACVPGTYSDKYSVGGGGRNRLQLCER